MELPHVLNLEVQAKKDCVVVSGDKVPIYPRIEFKQHIAEIEYGKFVKTFPIDSNFDSSPKVTYEDGVLQLTHAPYKPVDVIVVASSEKNSVGL